MEVDPIEVQGLPDLSTGYGSDGNPVPLPLWDTAGPAVLRQGSHTDASGNTSYLTADDFGNSLTWTDPHGKTTTWELNEHGLATRLTLPYPTGVGGLRPQITEYVYDSTG